MYITLRQITIIHHGLRRHIYIYKYEYIGDKIYECDLSIFKMMKKKVSKIDYRERERVI